MSLTQPATRLIVAAFLMDFAIGLAGLGFIELAIALHASPLVLGRIGTIGGLAYTLGCLVSGRLSDRIGRRRTVFAACLSVGLAWSAYGWVVRPEQILYILPIAGFGMAFFWPPVQAWLAELSAAGGKVELHRNIGRFNMFWCAGLLGGPVACGYLWSYSHSLPFVVAIATAVLLAGIAWSTPRRAAGQPALAEEPTEPAHPQADLFLRLAWAGNFASSLAMGTVKTLFPKLGDTLGYPPELVGWLIASIHGGQILLFYVGSRTEIWHYRLEPLLLAPLLGASGMAVAYYTSSPLWFALGFAASGMCAGVTYVGSLFYSLHGHAADRGGKAGLHEAVLGSGLLLGPLIGGKLADELGLRAPWLLGAGT
ncbi:MAG: MFS transporter, partial [Armatimonadetes bacterium]|nr:MFS transporter [Armatimonadota bacterium]